MKKFFTYFSIMLTLLSMVGCKSWLDINTNPNYVPEAKIKSLLPSALSALPHNFTLRSK